MEEPEADKDDFLEHSRENLCPWMGIFPISASNLNPSPLSQINRLKQVGT